VAGTQRVRDVILRDGTPLRLQTPTSDDYDEIKAFYDGLSEDSRYRRFHGIVRTDGPARLDADADGDARVVLLGWRGGQIVACGGYDRLREPDAAEVSFTVADEFQGRGVATRVLDQLADIAAAQGIRRFDADVLVGNRAMLHVFDRAGFGVRSKKGFDEVLVSLDIEPTEAVQERIEERDHVGVVTSLRAILAPSSIAVVGASGDRTSVGGGVFANLIEGNFQGVVLPINKSGGVARSVRAAPSLGELPETPELVVVAEPADEVLAVAAEAAREGARALVVMSAGFAEAGGDGTALEQKLLEIVRSSGLRMVGPNSLGVINNDAAVNLRGTFAGAPVPAGGLAISSQSGAVGMALLGHAAARRLGVSSFASLGNRADVSTNDLLEYWEDDESTAAVVLYVETFGNPDHFARIAQRVARRKPILAVKGRRVEAPPGGARSHTAAALRGDAVVDALLRQAGVIRFRTGQELFDAAEFFEGQPLPRGRRIGIASNSRGVATLAADACGSHGLTVASSLTLGPGAGPADYTSSVQSLLADEGIDAVMAYNVDVRSGDPRGVLTAIGQAAAEHDKPVVASVVDADARRPEAEHGDVPNFEFPEACAAVLARAVERREWLSRALGQRPEFDDADHEAARELVTTWLDGRRAADGERSGAWLTTAEADSLLATHGIPFVTSERCPDVERAVSAAAAVGGSIALKADFPPPAHATDVDAVLLGLEGEAAVRAGWHELERRAQAAGREWRGAIVQPLVEHGADVLLGALTDPDLGKVMALGPGGRQAGLGRDVAYRLLPTTDIDARELIDGSESLSTLLDGFRGSVALDREALGDLILRFATLLRAVPELAEADLNPVRCLPSGAIVLDARVRIERQVRAESVTTW